MLRYFPFGQAFNDKMGTFPMAKAEPLVEVDSHYWHEVALKRELLKEHPKYYYRLLSGNDVALWEVLERVLDNLVTHFPQSFELQKQGNRWNWNNRLLNETASFVFGDVTTLPLDPLDWVGRQVQEDLVLLTGPEATLAGGQLCFANDWCLDEKIGLSFWQLHGPVTTIVEPMMRAAEKLMERLPSGKSVWRMNWSVKFSDQLDMTSRHTPFLKQQLEELLPGLTPDAIGQKLFVRIERQTLTRLPRSGAVLFGIHTYQSLLAEEASDRDRALRMLKVFESTPPAMLDYKSMTPLMPSLINYLEQKTETD